MRGPRPKLVAAAVVVALTAGMGISEASAALRGHGSPAPGSPAQVAALVAASSSITSLPSSPDPTLTEESSDSPNHLFPVTRNGCLTTTAPCVFGDTTSRKTIVLFGDSHAQMWLPALAPIAKSLGYRLVLYFLGGCPAAWVTVYNVTPVQGAGTGPYLACNGFRRSAVAAIKKLRPALVLMSNRTSMVYSGDTTFFTDAQWKAGVKRTVDAIKTKTTKVAIIGDIVYLPYSAPQCLSAYPTSVQQCGTPNPNPTSHSHAAAEQAEAKSLKIGYINTLPWICTTVCSPVIGNFLAYLDQTHLDTTYVTYLTDVLQLAVKKVL